MRITRLYCPDLPSDGEFDLPKEEVAHLTRVLRLKAGCEIQVFDGLGRVANCRLLEIGRRHARATIEDWLNSANDQILDLTIAVAPAKGRRMTWLVEKLTELGVGTIQPLKTEFGQLSQQQFVKEHESWLKKSIEAAKQCGRNRLPEIPTWISPKDLCDRSSGQGFLGSPKAKPTSLWSLLETLAPDQGPFIVAIGPEAGFSEREHHDFDSGGFVSVCVGHLVLRIETAAIAFASAFRIRF